MLKEPKGQNGRVTFFKNNLKLNAVGKGLGSWCGHAFVVGSVRPVLNGSSQSAVASLPFGAVSGNPNIQNRTEKVRLY